MLEALLKEVELREECNPTRHSRTPQSDSRVHADGNRRTGGPATASTLLTGQQPNCAFCMGNHAHEDCKKVTDIKERKRLISKFGRCFNCIRKGHRARECRISVNCKQCKGKHHTSLCDLASQEGRGVDVNQAVSVTPISMHVGMGNRVALQTAQAVAKGRRGVRIRVLFDSASHKSFVTSRAVDSLGLDPLRSEW